MGSAERVVDIENLERQPLAGSSGGGERDEEETALCCASFEDMEDSFLGYHTAVWILYSLLLVLAWGIGLLMLLYTPVRRYVMRQEFRSRKLYLTPNAIVYKVTRPPAFPYFGALKKEKYIVLPSIADISIEQGYLQSFFGVYSMRIENVGLQRPSSDHVKIQGVANPRAFRMAVLDYLAKIKSGKEYLPDFLSPGITLSGDQIMEKLEKVGSSVKRVQRLIEKRHPAPSSDGSRTPRTPTA